MLLEIVNLNDAVKFMSPLVEINHEPFNHTWFVQKEENIEKSRKFVEDNFIETFNLCFPEQKINPSEKKQMKILKIYDKVDGQDDATLFYEYELLDSINSHIKVRHTLTVNYGSCHNNLYIQLS